MTDLPDTKPRRASFLPHDGEELQGQAPPDAYTRRVACENADRAIHQLMLDQKREAKRQIGQCITKGLIRFPRNSGRNLLDPDHE